MSSIRNARHSDVEVLSTIVCSCYDGYAASDGYPKEVIAQKKALRGSVVCIQTLLENEAMFVYEDEGLIKGMVSVDKNEITKLFIDPHYHGQGIGKALFAHAVAFIRKNGYKDMFLGALVQSVVPFYKQMGMNIRQTRTIDSGPCIGMMVTILEKELIHE